jgi:hypothetical protein
VTRHNIAEILEANMPVDPLFRAIQFTLTFVIVFVWAAVMWSARKELGHEKHAAGGMVMGTVIALWFLSIIWH